MWCGFILRWEAFFGSAMEAGDDVSDSASMYSVDRSVRSIRPRGQGGVGKSGTASISGSVRTQKKATEHRPVSSLKPKVRT